MQPTPRSTWSCDICRKRKVRCDSQNPCKNCIRREEQCTFPENAQTRQPNAHFPDRETQLIDLQERVSQLEAVLHQAGLYENTTQDGLRGPRGTSRENAPADVDVDSGLPADLTGFHGRPGRSDAALVKGHTPSLHPGTKPVAIEDLVTSRHSSGMQGEVHKHDSFDHHIIGGPVVMSQSKSNACGTKVRRVREIMTSYLPTKPVADQLLQSYLLNVEWIHHPLNVPEFQASYDILWHGYSIDDYIQDTQWLALLLVVLCLGNHFGQQQLRSGQEEDLFSAAQELLALSDHLANHSITAIQTLILMGLWLNNRGLSSTHHAQLALAIKMAMGLGLSKLDVETTDPGDDSTLFELYHKPLTGTSDIPREMKRRLWWSLLCQDYYTSSSCNFTYMIQPRQCRTELFSNLDEYDLPRHTRGISSVSAPRLEDVVTSASYHLLKIPFTKTAKDVTDLLNDGALSYDAVLGLEQSLWKVYDALPAHFKWSRSMSTESIMPMSQHVVKEHPEWQRLFLGFTVHNRVLRLHRPFMAHGYSDERMLHSRHATIQSALACVRLAEHGRTINFPGLRWWVVLVHIFTAAVALCIDYHFLIQYQRHRGLDAQLSQLTLARRRQISQALKLLRTARDHSMAAKRAIEVVDKLVIQAEQPADEVVERHTRKRQRQVVSPVDTREESAVHVSDSAASLSHMAPQSSSLGDAYFGVEPTHVLDTHTIAGLTRTPDALSQSPVFEKHLQSRPSRNGPESDVFLSPEYSVDDVLSACETQHEDTSADMQMQDWSGPDWQQLLASMSDTAYSSTAGLDTDLYNTLSSFADGFAP